MDLDNPTTFLVPSAETSHSFLQKTKEFYNQINNDEKLKVLDDLYIDGFDLNQIWEQIELVNGKTLKFIDDLKERLNNVSTVSSNIETFASEDTNAEDDDEEEDFELISGEEDEEEFDSGLEEYEEELKDEKSGKKSIVDDEFFSLEEMERFADMSEAHDIKMAKKMNQQNSEDDDEDEDGIFSVGRGLATGAFDFADDDENANGKFNLIVRN